MAKAHQTPRSAAEPLVPDSPEQAAFVSIVRTAGRLEGELNRVLRPYELTTATYTILKILDRVGGEGLSCGDIAHQLIAEVPDMTRLLDRLERLEYLVRERSRLDRRMVKVKITERGRMVVLNLKEPVIQCHRDQLGHLSEDTLATIQKVMAEIQVHEQRQSNHPAPTSEEEEKPHVGM